MTPYNTIVLSDYDRIPSFLARIVDGRIPAPRAMARYEYEDTEVRISITESDGIRDRDTLHDVIAAAMGRIVSESDTGYGSGEISVYGPVSLLRRIPQGGRV